MKEPNVRSGKTFFSLIDNGGTVKTLVATPDPICPWQRYVPVWVMLLLIERYGSVRIESYVGAGAHDAIIVGHVVNGKSVTDRFRKETRDWFELTETERDESMTLLAEIRQMATEAYHRRAEMAAWKLANPIN